MAWNIRTSRMRKVEEELQRAASLRLGGPLTPVQVAREVAVYELAAAAQLMNARGHGATATARAAGCAARLSEFSREHWPAMFEEARASVRRTSSDRNWPARSQALEQLIKAVQ